MAFIMSALCLRPSEQLLLQSDALKHDTTSVIILYPKNHGPRRLKLYNTHVRFDRLNYREASV